MKKILLVATMFSILLFPLRAFPLDAPVRAAESAADSETGVEVPNLMGTWELNEELSEDPREKMNDSRQGNRGGRRGGGMVGGGSSGVRGGGFGGGGRRGGGRRGGGSSQGDHGPAAAVQQLSIYQTQEEVSITNGEGRTHVLQPDGREREEFLRGYVTNVVTRWEGEKLVSRFEQEAGQTVTRSYELMEDGRLRVTIERDGKGRRGGMTFFRIYDAVSEALGAAE